MVKLRLARAGAKKKAYYRIVAADERYPRDGRFLEQVGTYDPRQKPAKVVLVKDALEKWLKNGASLTDTVENLIRSQEDGKATWNAVKTTAPAAKKASVERARASRTARKARKVAARKAAPKK